jgi:AAA domain
MMALFDPDTDEFFRQIDDSAKTALGRGGNDRERIDRELLSRELDVKSWATLDIPPEPRLLGSLITPSARVFLVGRTGLGKTLLGHGMAGGMASGRGFLHWGSERPSRWLVIDGEMPTGLIKARAADLIRRVGEIPFGYLTIYSQDRAEEFERQIPGLGSLEPINTEGGQRFVMRLAKALNVEGILFDNVMSLITGDQKDEVPWSQTLSLVSRLTTEKIAQVWLDHTGHNAERQYGSATKAWRMDAVGLMTPLADYHAPGEVAFLLSFEPPGKARRRTPNNWADFQDTTIYLVDDRWTYRQDGKLRTARFSPVGKLWYEAFLNALCRSDTPGRTTRREWYNEAVRTGLAEAITDDDDRSSRDRKMAKLRKYISELRSAGLLAVDGDTVSDLRKSAGKDDPFKECPEP